MVDTAILAKKFEKMGARVKIGAPRNRRQASFGIDIQSDAEGEYFEVNVPASEKIELDALDVQADLRHLLLMVRRDGSKEKYLCGHDERHWFVAGVGGSGVASVQAAMLSLQPAEVTRAVSRAELRPKDKMRRKNKAYMRQGEWFFVPAPEMVADEKLVLRHEPISRGDGGKPHICEMVYRGGGVTVYVCGRYPRGLVEKEYKRLLATKPEAKHWNWLAMKRDAHVYARGRVAHPDHKTIVLKGWHHVLMNTEHRRGVVFLD